MSEKKQVSINVVVNIVGMGSKFLIGLWLAPYLVRHIGTAAYGFVPIAAVLTEYVAIITATLNQAISRFLILAIQREDWVDANKVFNTAFFSNFGLVLLQVPVLGLILFNLTSLFTVPPELLHDLFYLCLFQMMAFFVRMFSSIFDTSLFAFNRLDVTRIKEFIALFVRIGVIVSFFTFDRPSLIFIGLGELLAAVTVVYISYHYWRKLTPKLRISLYSIDRTKLKSIVGMSVWLLINYLGGLLFHRVNIIIVNRFIGPEDAGQYAAVQQWGNIVTAVILTLSFLSGPLLLRAYANKEFDKLTRIAVSAVKVLGVVLAVLCGILMVQSKSLLHVWIGPEIGAIYPLLILLLLPLPPSLSLSPVFTVFTAYNRVKIPGTVMLLTGLGNFGLGILLVLYTDLGVYAVALATVIMYTIREAVFVPIYAARVTQTRWMVYFRPVLDSLMAFAIVLALASPILFFNIDSWLDLVVSSSVCGLIALPIVWKLVFTREEKALLVSLVPQKVRNKIKWFG